MYICFESKILQPKKSLLYSTIPSSLSPLNSSFFYTNIHIRQTFSNYQILQ